MINDNLPVYESTVGMSQRIEKPSTIYFFERSDGAVFPVQGEEAYKMYTLKHQNLSKKLTFKLIGTGTGEIFYQARLKAQEVGQTDPKEASRILKQGQQDELEACRGKITPPKPGALDKIWA